MTPQEKMKVRNETIDELCNWLDSCIAQVDRDSEVFKACSAMVAHMRTKKSPDTAYPDEQHYPLRQGG